VHKEEHAERLPEDADYLVVEEQDVVLAEIIEDELLLNIPFTPMHDDCDSLPFEQPEEETAPEPVKENPFLVLAALKKPSASVGFTQSVSLKKNLTLVVIWSFQMAVQQNRKSPLVAICAVRMMLSLAQH
jgi:hypothetical protein